MVITCSLWCDFVIWTPLGISVERIEVNLDSEPLNTNEAHQIFTAPSPSPLIERTASVSNRSSSGLASIIKVCLWNCRSIVNKLKFFQSFLQTSDFSVYAITESWCSLRIFDNEIIPPDFFIFRNDRDSRAQVT